MVASHKPTETSIIMGSGNVKIVDPYFQGTHGSPAAAWDDRPPAVAAPTAGDATLMHLYVPSGRTEVDYGAGSVPGIRMATDPHVHLTARNTLTTISLGTPAGDGISSGDPEGISIFTAGAKSETIEQCVKEYYKKAKSELINGRHTQTLSDEHYFDVTKNATYKFGANKYEYTVGNVESDMQDRKETIRGHSHTHAEGDVEWSRKGKAFTLTCGFSHDVFMGEKLSVVGLLSTSVNLGATVSVNVGARLDTSLAYQQSFVLGNKLETIWRNSISINKSAKVSMDKFNISKSEFNYKNAGKVLTAYQLALKKTDGADISPAAMKIVK